jgi:hypothetical protein
VPGLKKFSTLSAVLSIVLKSSGLSFAKTFSFRINLGIKNVLFWKLPAQAPCIQREVCTSCHRCAVGYGPSQSKSPIHSSSGNLFRCVLLSLYKNSCQAFVPWKRGGNSVLPLPWAYSMKLLTSSVGDICVRLESSGRKLAHLLFRVYPFYFQYPECISVS